MAEITEDQKEIIERFKLFVKANGGNKPLSDKTGISSPLISRHTTGETKELSSKSLRRLIVNGNMNIYWYLLGWGEMFRTPSENPTEYIMDSRHMETIEGVLKVLNSIPESIKSHSKLNSDRISDPIG